MGIKPTTTGVVCKLYLIAQCEQTSSTLSQLASPALEVSRCHPKLQNERHMVILYIHHILFPKFDFFVHVLTCSCSAFPQSLVLLPQSLVLIHHALFFILESLEIYIKKQNNNKKKKHLKALFSILLKHWTLRHRPKIYLHS